jgi:hypothetical protein
MMPNTLEPMSDSADRRAMFCRLLAYWVKPDAHVGSVAAAFRIYEFSVSAYFDSIATVTIGHSSAG